MTQTKQPPENPGRFTLAMDGVIQTGVPDRLGLVRRLSFFVVRRARVGGHATSLYALENDEIRPLGDPRVHFALNCMTLGCPRLPRAAFTADELDRQLDIAARAFLNDDAYAMSTRRSGKLRSRQFSNSIPRIS